MIRILLEKLFHLIVENLVYISSICRRNLPVVARKQIIDFITDYGHPERAFFKNLELLGLGRHFGLKFFEAFGVFSAGLSAPILVL